MVQAFLCEFGFAFIKELLIDVFSKDFLSLLSELLEILILFLGGFFGFANGFFSCMLKHSFNFINVFFLFFDCFELGGIKRHNCRFYTLNDSFKVTFDESRIWSLSVILFRRIFNLSTLGSLFHVLVGVLEQTAFLINVSSDLIGGHVGLLLVLVQIFSFSIFSMIAFNACRSFSIWLMMALLISLDRLS